MTPTDHEIAYAYKVTGSVWKAGDMLGIKGQKVHSRLVKLGIRRNLTKLTKEELKKLRDLYESGFKMGDGRLDALAKELGRTKQFLCRKANGFGLTDPKRKGNRKDRRVFKSKEEFHAHISACAKKRIAEKGHPRGMLGKKHNPEVREGMSKRMSQLTPEEQYRRSVKGVKTREKNGTLYNKREKQTWGAAWREIGGARKYYRSKWEANYARYLQWLKDRGEIQDWKHEPKTFWFDGVKRGTLSYLPDFWVKEKNGSEIYHEVKGWMDARSKTKLKRMALYHPEIKLILIREKEYKAIAKQMSALIPDWEHDKKGGRVSVEFLKPLGKV